jgi:hypothetical protein
MLLSLQATRQRSSEMLFCRDTVAGVASSAGFTHFCTGNLRLPRFAFRPWGVPAEGLVGFREMLLLVRPGQLSFYAVSAYLAHSLALHGIIDQSDDSLCKVPLIIRFCVRSCILSRAPVLRESKATTPAQQWIVPFCYAKSRSELPGEAWISSGPWRTIVMSSISQTPVFLTPAGVGQLQRRTVQNHWLRAFRKQLSKQLD